jgi:ferric-dicitrate binding protein FerR (iron transport regulator)
VLIPEEYMNNETSYNDYWMLATKYLSGEAGQEETNALKEWIEKSPANREAFETLKEIWEKSGSLSKEELINLDAEWDLLVKKLTPEEETIELSKVMKTGRSIGFYVARIAAGLIIVAITLFGGHYIRNNVGVVEVVAGSERKDILLPDGSNITLNVASSITYPKRFSPKSREIKLSGEAFFNVTPDRAKPFRVEGGSLMIEVLGTSFNVDAYENKDQVEVIVESGKVAVSKNEDGQASIVLMPGEKVAFTKSDDSLIKEQNKDLNFMAWKTRQITFKNAPLVNVVDVLNDVYQSKISIEQDDLLNCTLTATFTDQSLDAVLNVIQSTLDLVIVSAEETIQITGDGC